MLICVDICSLDPNKYLLILFYYEYRVLYSIRKRQAQKSPRPCGVGLICLAVRLETCCNLEGEQILFLLLIENNVESIYHLITLFNPSLFLTSRSFHAVG
jgi:hypothetical protein